MEKSQFSLTKWSYIGLPQQLFVKSPFKEYIPIFWGISHIVDFSTDRFPVSEILLQSCELVLLNFTILGDEDFTLLDGPLVALLLG